MTSEKHSLPVVITILISFAISPFILIFTLNLLLNLGIPYELKTWVAGLFLIYLLGPGFK